MLPNIIASNIYNTITIKRPLPPLLQHEFSILDILTPPVYSYIQAPSIIINKINSTKTIAAEDPQLPIYYPLLFCLFTLFYTKIKNMWVFISKINIKLLIK